MRSRYFARTTAAALLVLILPGVVAAQKVAAPAVVDLPFGAVDQSLWRDHDWFWLAEYRVLGERSFEGVFIRRHHNPIANTWLPGLELMATPRDDGKVEVVVRLTLTVPAGHQDTAIDIGLQLINSGKIAKKASQKIYIEEDEERSVEKTFVLTPAFLNARPAPTLRLIVSADSYTLSPRTFKQVFFSVAGGLLLIYFMRF